jgi:hypothetical protein
MPLVVVTLLVSMPLCHISVIGELISLVPLVIALYKYLGLHIVSPIAIRASPAARRLDPSGPGSSEMSARIGGPCAHAPAVRPKWTNLSSTTHPSTKFGEHMRMRGQHVSSRVYHGPAWKAGSNLTVES